MKKSTLRVKYMDHMEIPCCVMKKKTTTYLGLHDGEFNNCFSREWLKNLITGRLRPPTTKI